MTEEAPALGVQSIAYAGLDALLIAVPLELCGYLHVGQDAGPQLYLRRPRLADLEPNDAFRLFSTIRDQLDESGTDARRVQVDGFDAVMEGSSGPNSRGLWVAGRHDAAITESDAAVVGALGRAVMGVCHAAEAVAIGNASASVVRVTIETSDDGMQAEVALDHAGQERVGRGGASTALSAVASATLDAIDPSLKLVAADEDAISESRAVLVLVRDGLGRSSVGASLIGGDPLRAAATAAVIAAGARVG